jgi:hypothetical protein
MNDMIAKLYDQAMVLEGNGDYVAGELDPVKFAELIVQETLNVALYGNEFVQARTNVKTLFGVEND